MANQFDITPADPMGAANDWQAQLARTSILKSEAAIKGTQVGEEADKATKTHEDLLASQAFREKVSAIDPSVKPIQQLSLIAGAAISTGRFEDAEKALAGMAHLAQVSALEDLRKAQGEAAVTAAAEKKTKRAMELMEGIKDQKTKDLADAMFMAEFKEPSPYSRVPYGPQFQNLVGGILKNATEAAKAQEFRSRAGKEDATAWKERQIGDVQSAIKAEHLARAEKTREALGKVGGKIATVTAREEKMTADTLKHYFPNLDGADIAKVEVGQEAKALQAREGGDFQSAVNRIIAENPGRFKEVTTPATGFKALLPGDQSTKKRVYNTTKPKLPTDEPTPKGIPSGASKIGKTPDGKDVWEDPITKKRYVE